MFGAIIIEIRLLFATDWVAFFIKVNFNVRNENDVINRSADNNCSSLRI